MADDSDLAALLPEPPPARPEARDAAIGAALRRFDTAFDEAAETGANPEPAVEPKESRVRRPQLASVLAMVAVAVVSGAVWLTQRDQFVADHPEIAPPPTVAPAAPPAEDRSLGDPALGETTDSVGAEAAPAAPAVVAESAAAPAEPAAEAVEAESNLNRLPQSVAPPPPISIAVAPPPVAAPAPQAAAAAPTARSEGIVVTGSRIARADAFAGERAGVSPAWAACTVLDPARDIDTCRALADPAAPGARGRAAAAITDGLALAWRGERARALSAFDRAIAAEPGSALAYLNRGLLRRQNGDEARAAADLARAADLDPRYRAALP